MSIRIIRGDARSLPLADNSVDLIVTSPPYFGLRSYTDGGSHLAEQIGAEATPAEFVAALLECTREMIRVLKPSGSLWVNLGDKYSRAQAQNFDGKSRAGSSAKVWSQTNPKNIGIPNKSLIGLPWRYALACIDDLGLTLRAEVIWSKPNGLPESVTDRVRRSHEQWFHFTLQPRYYSAVDEIREPHVRSWDAGRNGGRSGWDRGDHLNAGLADAAPNPLGKLPGSVWTIATEPLKVPPELGVDHFAAFPSEWPRRLILGWSPREVCSACGEGRRPVAAVGDLVPSRAGDRALGGDGLKYEARDDGGAYIRMSSGNGFAKRERTITGYACACPDMSSPATPGVVLDPFGGTGTTAHVADALGRNAISVDLSADYCRLAGHPFLRDKRAAKVTGAKPKPKIPRQRPPVEDQLILFDDNDEAAS